MKCSILLAISVILLIQSFGTDANRGVIKSWNREGSVQYTIRNVLRSPMFDLTQKVPFRIGEPFQRIMETAATNDSRFRFTVSYFNTTLGYFVDIVNGVEGTDVDKTYWQFLEAPDIVLDQGVSNYKPTDGEHLILNFTRY